MNTESSYSAKKDLTGINVHMDALQDQLDITTVDAINASNAPKKEVEPQTLLSKRQVEKYDAPYIKPTIAESPNGKKKSSQDAMREKAWKYVKVIVENNEVKGERVDFWLKAEISGECCNYWQVPTNRPVYLPFHVAEHLSNRTYHKLKMVAQNVELGKGEIHSSPNGVLVADQTVNRIDCRLAGMELASGF